MGYPIITEEDLGISSDDIKDLLILPPMKNVYFAYFPKIKESHYEVNSTFSINFPDEFTFGLRDARINTKAYYTSGVTNNPFVNQINVRVKQGGMGMNMWGTGNDYDFSQVKIFESSERQAYIESGRATSIYVNYDDRKIEGYTNTYGDLSVDWARYSNDWNSVRFQHVEELIKLCQSYVAEYFGNLFNMDNAAVPNELEGSDLLSKAEDLRTEVMEKWSKRAKVVILR